MSKFWSDIVNELQPYVPGEQPRLSRMIKLNTNENPYPPSPHVEAALREESIDALRLYPDPNANALKQAIADYYLLTADQVFLGNGSDEVLAHVFQALLKHKNPLLFPDISYSFYPTYCRLYQIGYRAVPLNERFEIAVDDYAQPNGGIIFPNPNAPTGKLLSLDAIENLLRTNPDVVVVVDEAYIDFGGTSAIALINRYPNLLVVQTFSKSRSLAGLRVGFAVGDRALIEALERIKNSFNSYPLDRLAQKGAIAALNDHAYFDTTRRKIIASREWLTAQLSQMRFDVLPSHANFIFARHASIDGAVIAQHLRERAIIVRHFALPRVDKFLRITIGTDTECRELIRALAALTIDKT